MLRDRRKAKEAREAYLSAKTGRAANGLIILSLAG
jgi:hypothetical protein